MSAITSEITVPIPRRPVRRSSASVAAILAGRRFALTARTPRELLVPLLTPVLFALVIAPALKKALHTSASYESYVAVGTIGLLIPLNTMFSGISVLVDRESGARRELLAAPIFRPLLVVGNLLVAMATTALQVGVLLGFAVLRRIHFHVGGSGLLWFLAAALLFTIAMYGIAETLAARVPRSEEYIARLPAIAIVPWFLAGSLFPITSLPLVLAWFARFLPLTHALALMRWGLLHDSSGLQNIWRTTNTTAMASMSLAVVAAFAVLMTTVSIRVFARSAVQ
ncbi:MAG TPA: ABC transporter permease [Gaiellaceae bacterium]|jgi:ABC-2 type transport system permease protein|nr:ABC transporter permease [Gaiellaceae bacterium]